MTFENSRKVYLYDTIWVLWIGGILSSANRCTLWSRGVRAGMRDVTVTGADDRRDKSTVWEIAFRRRRRLAIFQMAIERPTQQPASARPPRNAPIAITSHSHQGIDQIEVTCSACYSESVLICLVKFGESKPSYAHAVRIPPACCVGIAANSNRINNINMIT